MYSLYIRSMYSESVVKCFDILFFICCYCGGGVGGVGGGCSGDGGVFLCALLDFLFDFSVSSSYRLAKRH